MLKQIQMASLAGVMVLLPVVSVAQIAGHSCNANIPETTPTSRFTDHADGTVTDTKTGLMWKKCSEGQTWNSTTNWCDGSVRPYNWKAALTQAQTLNTNGGIAGKVGWRVPNIKELRSIVELHCYAPAINLAVFQNTPASTTFWSSSPNFSSTVKVVAFAEGGDGAESADSSFSVRLVRDADNSCQPWQIYLNDQCVDDV